MIIIPEIKTVMILVPRTGTGSLRRAIKARYPESMLIYRHMEADGVPAGYDQWRRIGVIRDPLERLWSLYKFLLRFDGDHDADYIQAMRAQVSRVPFDEWIVHNRVPFTTPYDSAGRGRYWPGFTVRHPLPENRKSQFVYLRPDLGTEIIRFEDMPLFAMQRGLELGEFNATMKTAQPPPISNAAHDHMNRFFAWDSAARHALLTNKAIPLSQEGLALCA